MVPNAITGQGGLHPVGALKDPALLNPPEHRLRDTLDSEKITKFKFPPLGHTPMDVSLGECYGSGHHLVSGMNLDYTRLSSKPSIGDRVMTL